MMFGEKILALVAMFYFAIVIASMLKLERITIKNLLFSIFMPVIFLLFSIDFSIFMWKNDFNKFPLSRRIYHIFRLFIFEIQFLPQIHTKIVFAFKSSAKKKNKNSSGESKIFNCSFQKLRDELNPLIEF